MTHRVIIFEPNQTRAEKWKQSLEKQMLWVETLSDKEQTIELLKNQFFHLCIWPVDSPAKVAEVYELKGLKPSMAVLAVGEPVDSTLIVECIRAGASHFWSIKENEADLAELVSQTLKRIHHSEQEFEENSFPFTDMIGKHPKIREIYQLILRIKDSDSNVLITGESGTGKELVAQAIHTLSKRSRQPWMAVNCGAIPSNLLESELFGHVKGAFTGATQNRLGRFQLAGAGTLFLDEIGDLSMDLQAKILRAIQIRQFEPVGSAQCVNLNARIIAATNQNLESAVSEKKFREDLYYRLNVIPVFMPPLRSRKSDVPLLVHSFLKRFAEQNKKKVMGISEEAMRCLTQYHWPGNVRELENLMERVIVLKGGEGPVELTDFPVGYFRNINLDRFLANVALPEDGLDLSEAVNDFENELILQALRRTKGNKNKAANLLQVNRTTLVEKLKRKGIKISL